MTDTPELASRSVLHCYSEVSTNLQHRSDYQLALAEDVFVQNLVAPYPPREFAEFASQTFEAAKSVSRFVHALPSNPMKALASVGDSEAESRVHTFAQDVLSIKEYPGGLRDTRQAATMHGTANRAIELTRTAKSIARRSDLRIMGASDPWPDLSPRGLEERTNWFFLTSLLECWTALHTDQCSDEQDYALACGWIFRQWTLMRAAPSQ